MDWVTLRHECSPLEVFIKLKEGAEQDVEVRNKLKKADADFAFKVRPQNGKSFSVLCEGSVYGFVTFSWSPVGIKVTDESDKVIQEATLTLTDNGKCKLKLQNGEELECWQFRKRVLEDLFFNLK
jgi:hypothetical protein